MDSQARVRCPTVKLSSPLLVPAIVVPSAPRANRSLTKYKLIIDEFGGSELCQNLRPS